MTTKDLPLTIPEDLVDWQPACAMHEWSWSRGGRLPECDRPATLRALLCQCRETISCQQCFVEFSALGCRMKPPHGQWGCGACGTEFPTLSSLLKVVPLWPK